MKNILITLQLVLISTIVHAQNTDTLSFIVGGICDMCETRIEEAANSVSGIKYADWNRDTKVLKITYSKLQLNDKKLHKAINHAGHDTEFSRTPDHIYNKLHACCKYRDLVEIPSHASDKQRRMVNGILVDNQEGQDEVPLIGANIYWKGTQSGTITDINGVFEIERADGVNHLVISYLGYKNDTFDVEHISNIKLSLNKGGISMSEVIIESRKIPSAFSSIDPIKIQKISAAELEKAACCDLSESFTTNPNVEISTTDAVTGTKQIEMLGLAGPYVQIMRENMPDVRGLAALNGLTYTPGPWIEGIQLNVGSGSVVNGFESMTGQINVELIKPKGGDLLFVNTYANDQGKLELNLASSVHVNEHIGTSLLFNTSQNTIPNDHNNDGFTDHPTGERYNFVNRWKYETDKGLQGQIGIKTTFEDKTGGQHRDFLSTANPINIWESGQSTERIEGWFKSGKSFIHHPGRSMAIQVSGIKHDEESHFGLRNYNAKQQSLYSNLIYSDKSLSVKHSYKTGLSFINDRVNEELDSTLYKRNEQIIGVFGEYTFKGNDITLVSGLRADYHNNYGLFITPRINIKHQTTEKLVLRATVAKGHRTASIIAENISMLASSRAIVINSDGSNNPYGLNQEASWNFGINALYSFKLFERNASYSADYNRIEFEKQVLIDKDGNNLEVSIYNLEGKSYSNSIQTQLDFEPLNRFGVRIAYRFNDVQTEYRNTGLLHKPISAKHRAFTNLAYETNNKFKFDYTINWISAKRIPNANNRSNYSTPYVLSNAQISKEFKWGLDIYVGAENLFDFKQKNPIISAEDPFSETFDASLIWGPVSGRMIYAGLRYRIEGR